MMAIGEMHHPSPYLNNDCSSSDNFTTNHNNINNGDYSNHYLNSNLHSQHNNHHTNNTTNNMRGAIYPFHPHHHQNNHQHESHQSVRGVGSGGGTVANFSDMYHDWTNDLNEHGTSYISPVSQAMSGDLSLRDDHMVSISHAVTYSPTHSEGRLSIGTDDANLPHSVQFSPTDDNLIHFSSSTPGSGESRASNTRAQIEVIPCKVCSDKSSGVHYGVITCEGCKGFFRRSQSGPVNYQCSRNKNCVIDRVNRNRCQYCRLQKCIALGMSRDAVKFGRMSKKQREKVEDEANMVKASRLNGLNQAQFGSYQANGYSFPPPQQQQQQQQLVQQQQEFISESPLYSPNSSIQPSSQHVNLISSLEANPINLGKAITEAHLRTCLYSNEQIDILKQQILHPEQVDIYKNLSHLQLWVEIADKITMAVQQIIEFAKMIPGFMELSQDDQIMLLKAGSFELALMQVCRVFDAESNRVVFGNMFLPLEAFAALTDEEFHLMSSIFEFVKNIQVLNITESEMAMLSALILITSDRPGVKEVGEIQQLHDRILTALKLEMGINHAGDEHILKRFIEQACILRSLSAQHIRVLNAFKEEAPDIEFPALHKELFSIETESASSNQH